MRRQVDNAEGRHNQRAFERDMPQLVKMSLNLLPKNGNAHALRNLRRARLFFHLLEPLLIKCVINVIKKNTRKMKKSILAMPAAAMAMPVKPNIAAIIAMIKKTAAQ
jgi:hypothetical protein